MTPEAKNSPSPLEEGTQKSFDPDITNYFIEGEAPVSTDTLSHSVKVKPKPRENMPRVGGLWPKLRR